MPQNSIDLNVTPLRTVVDAMCLESFGTETFSALAQKLVSYLPDIRQGLKDLVSRIDGSSNKIEFLNSTERAFVAKISKIQYGQLARMKMQTPHGFAGSYAQAIEELNVICEKLSRVNGDVVQPYSVFLGSMVSDANARISTKHDFIEKLEEFDEGRKKHLKTISGFYEANSAQETAEYTKVIGANSEWVPILSNLKKCIESLNGVNLQILKQRIKDCCDLIDVIYDNLKQEGGKVAQQTAQNLAEGAQIVAEQVELYALTHFRVLAFREAIDKNINMIIKHV